MDAATNTGVDDVRSLQELVQFHPTRDRYRVIIVDEVHMLSKSAFNALLKTIEEPPPYILWIFATTERIKVPDTILSRCQQLEFRPVGTDLIRERLQTIASDDGFTLVPSAAAAIAAAAEGSVRDALSLLDQLRAFAADVIDDDAVAAVIGVPPVEVTVDVLRAIVEGRVSDGLSRVREQLSAGRDAHVLYRECGRALRTALHLAIDPELEKGLAESHRALVQPLADEVGADGLGRMLGLWLEHGRMLDDTTNRELALEVVILRMSRWPSVRALEDWLANGGSSAPAPGAQGAPSSGLSGADPATNGGSPSAGSTAPPTPETAASPGEADRPDEQPSAADAERERELEALAEAAKSDPGVALATKVLGGEIVAVRPDREAG
jgi:DNA polymerase-3 subunit gamma/tau